jgi:[acyl-carrier-protein] S-malonyltransferase
LKRVAFIFPGQGSQSAGMGKDFYENSETARVLIDNVSAETGIDFKNLMFEKNGDLEQTQFTQPAILLVSAVAHKLFSEKLDLKPTFLLGHSLGEFSALLASGSIDLVDAVKLVNRRGELMAEACSDIDAGMMAVIGLSNDKVDEVCETARAEGKKVWGANFNSDGQVVVAGIKSDLESVASKFKEAGAKRALLLNMSVASHCELLNSATDELRNLLNDKLKDEFSAPIISNVTTKSYSTKSEAIELLSNQLVQPVKWSESIENLRGEVDLFIEFGHGSVLKGLIKRVAPEIAVLNVSDMKTLEATISELSI